VVHVVRALASRARLVGIDLHIALADPIRACDRAGTEDDRVGEARRQAAGVDAEERTVGTGGADHFGVQAGFRPSGDIRGPQVTREQFFAARLGNAVNAPTGAAGRLAPGHAGDGCGRLGLSQTRPQQDNIDRDARQGSRKQSARADSRRFSRQRRVSTVVRRFWANRRLGHTKFFSTDRGSQMAVTRRLRLVE
jgi:hypothetical protein